jgi:phosphate transport system permease protein
MNGSSAGVQWNRARKTKRSRTSLLAHGENMVWLTSGALAISLVMIVGLLALIVYQGVVTFWPKPLVNLELLGGGVEMGEITRQESFRIDAAFVDGLPEAERPAARALLGAESMGTAHRSLVRTGNFDITGKHFQWVNDFAVARKRLPDWAVVVERRAWGRFYGYPKKFLIDDKPVAKTPDEIWQLYDRYQPEVARRFEERYKLQKYDFGRIHARLENARLDLKKVEMESGVGSPEYKQAREVFEDRTAGIEQRKKDLAKDIELLQVENNRYAMVFTTSDGREATLRLADIVRAYPANRLSAGEKAGIYLSRWWEFLTAEPREANSEGGVWPAIVGTVIMTLLMSIAVVPFGVLAALYLREYGGERCSYRREQPGRRAEHRFWRIRAGVFLLYRRRFDRSAVVLGQAP